ncbi:MAG TPA: aromatic ring-hydroxylating dioxygenase subunit alpha, partial [Candidatus Binataceae bacterium]|nr:aromatic ring-hydroxylating dioxygenase subunit alpha [Candidatus Binataceae bacterium]
RVNRTAFTDPECLERERRLIFDHCWLYAGHESEIPTPGDFRSRRVAGRPTVLVRGDDGVIRLLLNTCTHRGAMVCRENMGNAKSFQCPYHAWTYNSRGELIGVPGEESYSAAFSRARMRLAQAPRLASYRGFIFVSFDPAAPSLEDYLAGAKEYLDLVCDQSEAGMAISPGTQAYSIRANWKLLVENSFDGYHGLPTHARYFGFLRESGGEPGGYPRQPHRTVALGNGHAAIEYDSPFGRPIARWAPIFGELAKARIEAARERLERRFGRERANRMTQTSRNLVIFPNLVINDIMAITVRNFYPVAPDYMEVSAWNLAPADETEEDRALRLDNFLTFLGPGGYATPDDVEMLESCQRGFANREVQWSDISRGMTQEDNPPISDELQIRAFWRQWNDLMRPPRLRRAIKAA